MGVTGRFKNILKSQLNYLLMLSEDPEKIISQAIEEIDEALSSARKRVALKKSVMETNSKLFEGVEEEITELQISAEDYLKDEMEEHAKEALIKKRFLAAQQKNLALSLKANREAFEEMERKLSELEAKVRSSKAKRELLLKKIRLSKGIHEQESDVFSAPSALYSDDPFETLVKMEERVDWESQFKYPSLEDKEFEDRERKIIEEEMSLLKKNLKLEEQSK